MTSLVFLEARRFCGRRLVRVLAVVFLIGVMVAAPAVFARSHNPALAGVTADTRFHITALREAVIGAGAFLVLFGLVGGATFAGADWHYHVVRTTLTWEPRRTRVLLAKVIAVFFVVAVAAIGLDSVLAFALVPAAAFRGTTDGATVSWALQVMAAILRVGALAGLAAAIGVCLAFLSRTTAGALGGLLVWIVVGENAIRAGFPGWRRWLVADNVGAFVSGGDPAFVRSASTAGALLAAYTLFALAAATASFRHFDVD